MNVLARGGTQRAVMAMFRRTAFEVPANSARGWADAREEPGPADLEEEGCDARPRWEPAVAFALASCALGRWWW